MIVDLYDYNRLLISLSYKYSFYFPLYCAMCAHTGVDHCGCGKLPKDVQGLDYLNACFAESVHVAIKLLFLFVKDIRIRFQSITCFSLQRLLRVCHGRGCGGVG